LSLEFLIRGCLFKKEGQENTVPNLTKIQEGQLIPKNALTNYDNLGQIIQKFNKHSDIVYKIDQQKILRLRDGIAHGRILSDAPDAINKLLKFSKPKNNDVEVEIAIELTDN
jgi:hypothetical protein